MTKMLFSRVDFRVLTDLESGAHRPEPALIGDLIVSCCVVYVDERYEHARIDIKAPDAFTFPDPPIAAACYIDGKYSGKGLLSKIGLETHPNWPGETPYFTPTFSRTPGLGAC
jgi:hypothetical protein